MMWASLCGACGHRDIMECGEDMECGEGIECGEPSETYFPAKKTVNDANMQR